MPMPMTWSIERCLDCVVWHLGKTSMRRLLLAVTRVPVEDATNRGSKSVTEPTTHPMVETGKSGLLCSRRVYFPCFPSSCHIATLLLLVVTFYLFSCCLVLGGEGSARCKGTLGTYVFELDSIGVIPEIINISTKTSALYEYVKTDQPSPLLKRDRLQ